MRDPKSPAASSSAASGDPAGGERLNLLYGDSGAFVACRGYVVVRRFRQWTLTSTLVRWRMNLRRRATMELIKAGLATTRLGRS